GKTELASDDKGTSARRAVPVEIIPREPSDVTETGRQQVTLGGPTQAYVEAALSSYGTTELHEAPISILAELVKLTVSVEGPVHVDEVITRIRSA
ncbi:DUF3320 domain-containing protein, partial [Burkholderia sp. SIMBA_052]|uniref:DUF3320 domain-containing protein n=1 Tax=Burkholderia sp. SIMBA_052 TaxID=3085793 RepID=UPI00397D19F3